MQLFINENIIPFEIGNEKNAADVIASLQLFSNKNDFVISEIKVNDEAFSTTDSSLTQLPIKKINEVRCTMENPTSYAASLLFQISERLDVFTKNYSREEILDNFENISNRLDWVQEVLKKSGTLLGLSEPLLPVEAQVQGLRLLAYGVRNQEKNWDTGAAASLTSQISANLETLKLNVQLLIYQSVLSRKNSTSSDFLNVSCNLAKQTVVECEKIAIGFQSGKPLEGLTRIVTLMDSIQILQKGSSQLKKVNSDIENQVNEIHFNEVMEQLEEVKTQLEDENFVELSDIIEYELQPALASLSNGFQNITLSK